MIDFVKIADNIYPVNHEWKYNDLIYVRKGADIGLSAPDSVEDWECDDQGMLAREIADEHKMWGVDAYESGPEGEPGMLNINRVGDPYPGAYCSWISEEDAIFIETVDRRRKASMTDFVKIGDNIYPIQVDMPYDQYEGRPKTKENLPFRPVHRKRFRNEPGGLSETDMEGLDGEKNQFRGMGTENSYAIPGQGIGGAALGY